MTAENIDEVTIMLPEEKIQVNIIHINLSISHLKNVVPSKIRNIVKSFPFLIEMVGAPSPVLNSVKS